MSTIVLSSPPALVASLPYLVGFHPKESIVLVWLCDGEIVLTQRADVPARVHANWLATLWHHPASGFSDSIIVVAVSDTPGAATIVHAVVEHAREQGMHVRDALVVCADTWVSVLCEEPGCSCSTGHVVPAEVRTAVGAEFAYRGVAPADGRHVLEKEVSHTPGEGEHLALSKRGIARPITPRALERWRDRSIAEAVGWLRGSVNPSPTGRARVVAGLQDVRVRDVLLWELAQAREGSLRDVLMPLQAAVRVSPDDYAAAVATVTAIAAWLLGDGARASICLRRALAADPHYSLAQLVDLAIAAGLPPAAWRDGTAQVSRVECRHGIAALARPGGAVL